MDEKRNMIYLAALLHDIGKFYQRASSKSIKEVNPNYEKKEFGYQHSAWTYDFFMVKEIKNVFIKVPGLKQNLYENQSENQFNVTNLATNHHAPQTILEAMVTMGDGWSAGIDRQNPTDIEGKKYGGKEILWGKERYKTIPLFSVFNIINRAAGNVAFPMKTLDLERDNIFPRQIDSETDGTNLKEYQNLWKNFITDFKKLPTDSFDGFVESLTFLLKKYTWAIPSNTMDMANVSLFEHLKTTAAFADSIYCYYSEYENDFNWNASDKRLTLKENKYPAILYGLDISGIQKFIYNISSSKAAKSLKGRSFYLQLLIEAMVHRIITHPDIKATTGHIVYSSGGKFYMILPNTGKVKKALQELKKEFDNDLWNEHKGKLSVNTGFVPFAYRSVKENNKWLSWIKIEGKSGRLNLGDLWKEVADQINIEKNKAIHSLLTEKWEEFFDENNKQLKVKIKEEKDSDEQQEICAVTGEVLDKAIELDKDTEGNPIYVSKQVKDQADLGTTLKDADYLIMFNGNIIEDKYLRNRAKTYISILGLNFYLFDDLELIKNDAEFRGITSVDTSRIYRINKTDFLAAQIKGKKVSYGFIFYGGNKQAELNKKEKTYEQLTQVIPRDKNSETYLGILRMDIDNLGDIFIKGFDEKQKSFASFATLSFLLDLFFSGYLNSVRNSEEFKDWVNILYSGGDDIFAVGRWDTVIAFAETVRKEFGEFTGRDDITISGGMIAVRNKFPISKAAEMAGNAEDQSKDFNSNIKNAFTFFGETVSWNDEFSFVKDYQKDFYLNVKKGMTKAILHRLMIFDEIKKENDRRMEDPGFNPDLSYKWNTAYYLKRFTERKNNKEHKEFIQKLLNKLFADKSRNYDLIALACRWAELRLKLEK